MSAESCGDFIRTYYNEDGPTDHREPIWDCDNPFFSSTSTPHSDVTYQADNIEVSDGDTLYIATSTNEIQFSSEIEATYQYDLFIDLYRHEGQDYRLVFDDTESPFSISATGTYTVVTYVNMYKFTALPSPSTDMPKSWWSWLMPTVYAAQTVPDIVDVHTLTFTISDPVAEPEPTGASSVLFLPGIQASRLYIQEGEGENKLWETAKNSDINKLAMSEAGISLNNVYTNDVIQEIGGIAPGANIYKSFFALLDDYVETETIYEFQPFAYDWRHSVFDVASESVAYRTESKRLLDEVLRMAANSYTGKVTIIGHSNGGLAAKALLYEYGENELEGKVDKLVMIGTPQLGTPKGISALLHGKIYDGISDLLLSDKVIRNTSRNMPGSYTLLPSARYFSDVADGPLITSDGSQSTQAVREYGDIASQSQLADFLLDTKDVLSNNPTTNQPLTLNSSILETALEEQDILDSWQAPTEVSVYEVAGTGLATISGIKYEEFDCSDANAFCVLSKVMKPKLQFDNRGDQTVIAGSAAGYEGRRTTAVVDLFSEGDKRFVKERNHADLTESEAVQTFVGSVIKYPYLTDAIQVPDFTEVAHRYTIVSTHSPVTPVITDKDGLSVGRQGNEISEDIIGSQYIEMAGSTYLIVPHDGTEYTLEVMGDAEGVFTLVVEELTTSNEQKEIARIVASSTPDMFAALKVVNNDVSNLLIDFQNDGEVDEEWTSDGEMINAPEENYTYTDLRSVISTIEHRFTKRYLGRIAKMAQRYHKRSELRPYFARAEVQLLSVLEQAIRWAERWGRVEEGIADELAQIIENLKN